MLAQDPARAEEKARDFLKTKPGDPIASLIVGSARRRLRDPAAAYQVLAPLAKSYPRAANTHYELGATLADLGRTAEAIAALRYATALNPNQPEAWRVLGEQLFKYGAKDESEAAFAELLVVSVRNPALRGAAKALSENQLAQAENQLRDYLIAHPSDVEALRLMGDTLVRLARYGDAEVILAFCLELDASQDGARFIYANALFRQQKAEEAVRQAERLLRAKPDESAYLNLLAACLGLIGDDARVEEICRRLSDAYPKQPHIWLNYGHALRAVGKQEAAIAAYRQSIALNPGLGEGYLSLANLKVVAFTPEEEAAMQREAARANLGAEDRLHLHYALGKAMEDRSEFASSFAHYQQAAQMRRAEVPYDADDLTALVQRSKALFTPQFFAARQDAGDPSRAPIFILGLPRSGSTLIEQILASHSQVEGTRELSDIGLIATDLGWMSSRTPQEPYPARLATLDAAALTALGRSYLDKTGIHRKQARPFFIDKMPNNFQHVGLIHLMLPHAKIIDARRHPLGACFSAFKQHFAQGQAFSYDLADLGRYYRDYVDLMAHFDGVLPGLIHRVIYEDMVEDTETSVRRVLKYCGLPFEEACLNFHENARSVRTVSSEQVRRPIFREGLNQWQNYEDRLGPLKIALGPALENWRGD